MMDKKKKHHRGNCVRRSQVISRPVLSLYSLATLTLALAQSLAGSCIQFIYIVSLLH